MFNKLTYYTLFFESSNRWLLHLFINNGYLVLRFN